ncbi:hypothetical protein [Sphingopyxis sp. QXT-31]|uniref:hypothetical protein n=1 Tax=Sphingopyxis sp. QXT-31 TaxID=1357916 RepID=UPI0012EB3C25|nr:hypothetical protein [Sphingopyxis sp. QXT-31]
MSGKNFATWWRKLPWQGKLLVGWAAFAFTSLVLLKLADLAGFSFPERSSAQQSPFSRDECIRRHQSSYFDRNPDMLELTDDQISRVARACAIEESEYYNW